MDDAMDKAQDWHFRGMVFITDGYKYALWFWMHYSNSLVEFPSVVHNINIQPEPSSLILRDLTLCILETSQISFQIPHTLPIP